MTKKANTALKRQQVEKVMRNMSKAPSKTKIEKSIKASISNVDPSLKTQYEIIRKDLLKLREDLAKSYDVAKHVMDKKGLVKQLLSLK